MAVPSNNALFQPIKVGRLQLAHRIAMAPLTRFRADENHVHGDLAVEYYSQRATTPQTLLIAEATVISPGAGGHEHTPGIYTTAQISAWKRITDAVHAKRSFIYLQLWAPGRVADPKILTREGNFPYISASAKRLEGEEQVPRALTVSEIQKWVQDYAQAARNAVSAGFDGVEIHGANGYLIDQFLQDVTNERTDEYGGNIERRSRFGLEVVKAVVDAIGQDRTGIRLSPWTTVQGMGMADPIPQFSHIIQSIRDQYPDFAYVHLIEPPMTKLSTIESRSNDHFRQLWAPRPFLSAGGHKPKSAPRFAKDKGDIIVFGKYFISNPDLPQRIKHDIPLSPYNPDTFFLPQSPIGYIDYPSADISYPIESMRDARHRGQSARSEVSPGGLKFFEHLRSPSRGD